MTDLSTNQLPSFMAEDAGKGLENVTAEMTVWVGPTGDIDPDEILKLHGYDAASPLDMLLRAIIDGNPDEQSRTADERLEIAKTSLLGQRRRRGRDQDNDDKVLAEIARRFYKAGFAADWDISLASIIRESVAAKCERLPATPELWDSLIRRLRIKFMDNRDVLLVRASSETDYQRMDDIRTIRRILLALKAMGVNSDDREALRPC